MGGSVRAFLSTFPLSPHQDCYVIASNTLGTVCSLVAPNIVTVATSNFDTFNLGSINGQQGWSAIDPLVDQAIVSDGTSKVFRLSNGYTEAVGFQDMPRTPLVPAWVGEPGSESYGPNSQPANASTICFAVEVKSSNGTVQNNLSVDLSFYNQANTTRISRLQVNMLNAYPNQLLLHTDVKVSVESGGGWRERGDAAKGAGECQRPRSCRRRAQKHDIQSPPTAPVSATRPNTRHFMFCFTPLFFPHPFLSSPPTT